MGLKRRYHAIKWEIRQLLQDGASELIHLAQKVGVARSRRSAKSILFIDEMLPDGTFGAGYPRAAEIVRALLGSGWQVTIYPMEASRAHYASVSRQFPAAHLLPTAGVRGLARLLRVRHSSFGVVLVSRPEPMAAFKQILQGRPEAERTTNYIYDAEALIVDREVRRREVFGNSMSADEVRKATDDELKVARGAKSVWAVTALEAGKFARYLDVPTHVVSHGVPVRADAPGQDHRRDFLFVGRAGGDFLLSPNVDSLIWFVEAVMPILDTMIGAEYRLRIVGLADDDIRARLAGTRVVFEGTVSDADPIYDACRVFVAPTRFSAGLPLKVCEAMAKGIPCVATSELVLQAQLVAGQDVAGAGSDDPRQFASACARLYTDRDHWEAIQKRALTVAEERFSTRAFRRDVLSALAGDDALR